METHVYNPMQTVKRHFFALRNGVIADTLRKAGSPFKIIFGLNLPQIAYIAAETGTSPELAEALWNNSTTRESMLLAPMLVDRTSFSEADARRWISSVPCTEIADVLCHRLLRHCQFAWPLAESLVSSPAGEFDRYIGLRLLFNIVGQDPAKALSISSQFRGDRLADMLSAEARFLMGCEND